MLSKIKTAFIIQAAAFVALFALYGCDLGLNAPSLDGDDDDNKDIKDDAGKKDDDDGDDDDNDDTEGPECKSNRDCEPGLFCIDGACEEIDEDCKCPTDDVPVCGKDGKTYPNICVAQCLGLSLEDIEHEGECVKPPSDDDDADDDDTADDDDDNDDNDDDEPCNCDDIYAPVCGADGKTYSNECEAACAKVKVAHEGECEEEPVCPDINCALNCVLQVDPETGCEICKCVGQDCECTYLYEPVCGEDGITYPNKCEAGCAGIAIAYEGRCEIPCDCPDTYKPVCGVDGITYMNKCEAVCLNVKIAHEGKCEAECEIYCAVADPVCGVDGVTYWCGKPEADCYGVEIAYKGQCKTECEPVTCDLYCEYGFQKDPKTGCEICKCNEPPQACKANRDCPQGQICQNGVCVPRPNTGCSSDKDCALGETCRIDASGFGVCVPGTVPSECKEDSECPAGYYCEVFCGNGWCSGVCKKEVVCECPKLWEPVCGEDGKTYANECEADCRNIKIAYRAACNEKCQYPPCRMYCPDGYVVGKDGCPICECYKDPNETICWSDKDCPEGQICVWDSVWMEYGVCKDGDDDIDDCMCPTIYAPVCGVDGNTYGNKCEAECAGVKIAYPGECASAP